ncbi:hypothetical protein BRADI_3g34616v3 [Brachypodium distachyon]|uniref:Uncharacterized protein n=1 Tax=Brachypodium distachyon TaxID=15368 RepID=A0A2K2D126_BRADI|nr:hypothetical protein BRADI_3g34616v3 [Brachypodium distachyon]
MCRRAGGVRRGCAGRRWAAARRGRAARRRFKHRQTERFRRGYLRFPSQIHGGRAHQSQWWGREEEKNKRWNIEKAEGAGRKIECQPHRFFYKQSSNPVDQGYVKIIIQEYKSSSLVSQIVSN